MGYPRARLEHALRTYRQTAPYRKRRGLSDTYLGQYLNRELRKTTRTSGPKHCQSWNLTEASENSEADEYHPTEERRSLVAARKRRRETNLKRQTVEVSEEDRMIKKLKGEEELSPYTNDTRHVVLRLTSQKGKEMLKELSQDHRIRLECSSRKSVRTARDSDRRRGTAGGRRSRRWSRHGLEIDGLMDVNGDGNDVNGIAEDGRSLEGYVPPTRTELRSGRILKKENSNSKSLQDGGPPQEVKKENLVTPLQQPVRLQSDLPIHNRSTTQIGASSSHPIEIESSDDEESQEEKGGTTHERAHNQQDPLSSPSSHLNLYKSTSNAPYPYRNTPTTSQITTSDAHPINFRLIPTKTHPTPCDFCSNWAMGIVGLGKRSITVSHNPSNPSHLVEIANGHQLAGHPPTKMCVKCSLSRLLIMRCHGPTYQPVNPSHINRLIQHFTPIRPTNLTRNQVHAYIRTLFARSDGTTNDRSGPLPSCSLCPMAASWKCCKWQERDLTRRPCRVPRTLAEADAIVAGIRPSLGVSSLRQRGASSSSSSSSRLNNMGSTPLQRPYQSGSIPEIITILDSSDEEEGDGLTLHPSYTSTSMSTSTSASTSASSSTSTSTSTSTPSTQVTPPPPPPPNTNSSHQSPPLRGCGLTLCQSCHTFISDMTRGLLNREVVMEYLESTRIKGRADVEWLFEGSVLEAGMQGGPRRADEGEG